MSKLYLSPKKIKNEGDFQWESHLIRADLLWETLSKRKGILRETPPICLSENQIQEVLQNNLHEQF